MNFISRLFIFTGFAFLIFGAFLVLLRYNGAKLSFDNFVEHQYITSGVMPQKIMISSIKVELPIFPAKIKGNKWEATDKGISYLSSSPIPGSQGNSILYGHNWSALLGSLPKIKPGDKIKIILSNGQEKNFVVKYTSIVAPSDTKILSDSADSRITLYTCAGFLDSKRFVATALLKN